MAGFILAESTVFLYLFLLLCSFFFKKKVCGRFWKKRMLSFDSVYLTSCLSVCVSTTSMNSNVLIKRV